MNYTFYLHDLFYEIGHSNVTIDMINNLPNRNENTYHFVVYSSAPAAEIFPECCEQVSFHFVPFKKISPVFFKIIFFQIYTLIYSLLFDRHRMKISLGVANLNCDISIIHFIHHQWFQKYFDLIRPTGIRKLYKYLFFKYLNLCEIIMFRSIRPKVITVSDFLAKYIKDSFNLKDVTSVHSGFDLTRFKNSNFDFGKIVEILSKENSSISSIDITLPICLFVGAFERKGLDILLKRWKVKNNSQLIIIGKSEGSSNYSFSKDKNIFYLPYTKNINLYYEISDYFLFPTHYEPFGMVLLEAAVKGINIITTAENVGASEILKDLKGITISSSAKDFSLPSQYTKLTDQDRAKNAQERIYMLSDYNWEKVSNIYKDYLI